MNFFFQCSRKATVILSAPMTINSQLFKSAFIYQAAKEKFLCNDEVMLGLRISHFRYCKPTLS